MKTFFEIQIPNSTNAFANLEGKWKRKIYWDWNGTITANEPIVAISFLLVGNRIEWARSQKDFNTKLNTRLLFGTFDSDPKDVSASFSIGSNGPRWRTLLGKINQPPEVFSPVKIAVGKPFSFCKPFGNPKLEFFGLILLREQVISKRNELWHIKKICEESLAQEWLRILTFGRAGSFNIEQ